MNIPSTVECGVIECAGAELTGADTTGGGWRGTVDSDVSEAAVGVCTS